MNQVKDQQAFSAHGKSAKSANRFEVLTTEGTTDLEKGKENFGFKWDRRITTKAAESKQQEMKKKGAGVEPLIGEEVAYS